MMKSQSWRRYSSAYSWPSSSSSALHTAVTRARHSTNSSQESGS